MEGASLNLRPQGEAMKLRCDLQLLQVVKALHFLQKELRIIHRGMEKDRDKGGIE